MQGQFDDAWVDDACDALPWYEVFTGFDVECFDDAVDRAGDGGAFAIGLGGVAVGSRGGFLRFDASKPGGQRI